MQKYKRFSLYSVFSQTVDLLLLMFKNWRVFLAYAGVLTIITLFFGRWSYSCESGIDGFWCYNFPRNNIFAVLYLLFFYLIEFFVMGSFVNDYYNTAFKNSVFKLREIFVVSKQKFKNILFLLFCLLALILPMVVAYKILQKPANPHWLIEFGYFVVMFIMAFIPILFIRLSAFIAYYLQDGKIPPLQDIWRKTIGKTHVNIIIFLVLLFFINILLLRSMGALSSFTHRYNMFIVVLVGEYADCLIKLFSFALIICFCRAQYDVLQQIDSDSLVVGGSEIAAENTEIAEKLKQKKKAHKTKIKISKRKKDVKQ